MTTLLAVLRLPLLTGCLSGVAVFALVLGLGREARARRTAHLDRLLAFDDRGPAPVAAQAGGGGHPGQMASTIDRLARKTTFAQGIESDLRRAGVALTVGEFLVIMALLISLGIMLGLWARNPALTVVLGVAGYQGPRQWVRQRQRRRARQFDAQLAAMIALLASSVRSGQSLPAAFLLAAQESPPPMSIELHYLISDLNVQMGLEAALSRFVARMPSKDLEMLATALAVQLRSGGDSAEILDSIGATIRERVALHGEMRSLTAQQSLTGTVLALMPVALAGFLLIVNPRYLLNVFQTAPHCAWPMFGVAAVMIALGVVVMRRMMQIRV